MLLRMLQGKIHRATVTQANVQYEGSITVAGDLLDAAGILEHEAVQVWNVDNGRRFETYTIRGTAKSGVVCVNGAAARLVSPGDLVIIAAFRQYTRQEAVRHQPKLVFVDNHNHIREIRPEVAGPQLVVPIGSAAAKYG